MARDTSEIRVEVSMLQPTKEAEKYMDMILTSLATALCNGASCEAILKGRNEVTSDDIMSALEKVLKAGVEGFRDLKEILGNHGVPNPSNN